MTTAELAVGGERGAGIAVGRWRGRALGSVTWSRWVGWAVAGLVLLAALGQHHSHLGERSWAARGGPDSTVRVEGELIQHEWWMHLEPALWANGAPLPDSTPSTHIYRAFPSYLHALAWALTGNVVRGLVLVTDVFWAGAALATMALAGMATRGAVGRLLAGLLVALSPGFLALQWHLPQLSALCLAPVIWLVLERTDPYRPGAPPGAAALMGLLLGVGALTYDLHLPLGLWLLLVVAPDLWRSGPAGMGAGGWRLVLTMLCLLGVYGGWLWLSQAALVGRIESLNEPAPFVRQSLERITSGGVLAYASERGALLLGMLRQAFTWPVLCAAVAGLFVLPRRWAWRAALLVAVFAAGALLTKGEARIALPGMAGVAVLAAGGVEWAGRKAAALAGPGRGRVLRGLLVAALVLSTVLGSMGELWGDYSYLRSWW